MNYETPFDFQQYDLQMHGVIEASAGTGKTTAIVNLIARLQREKNIPLERILILTYTRKATQELKSRLMDKLSQEKLLDLQKESQLKVQTTYSFLDEYTRLDRIGVEESDLSKGINSEILKEAKHIIKDYFIESQEEEALIFQKSFQYKDLKGSYFKRTQFLNYETSPFHNYYHANNQDLFLLFNRYDSFYFLETGFKGSIFSPEKMTLKVFQDKEQQAILCFQKLKLILEKYLLLEKSQQAKLTVAIQKKLLVLFDWMNIQNPFEYESLTNWFYVLKSTQKKGDLYDTFQQCRDNLFLKECLDLFDQSLDLYEQLSNQVLILLVEKLSNKFYSESRMKKKEFQEHIVHFANYLGYLFKGNWGQQFDYIFIDEFQDNSLIEWETIKTLFLAEPLKSKICLVGDPKQSIYQFKGGDVNAYLLAKKELIHQYGAKLYTLDKNYRTISDLIEMNNHLFSHPHFFGSLETDIDFRQNTSGKIDNIFALSSFKPLNLLIQKEVDEKKQDQKNALYDHYRQLIQQIQKEAPQLKIAILGQENKDLGDMKACLEKHQIRCLQNRQRGLLDSEITKIVMLIFFALSSRAEKADILNAFLTPFFSLKDLDQYSEEIYAPYFDFIEQLKQLISLQSWYDLGYILLYRSDLQKNVSIEEFFIYEQLIEVALMSGQSKHSSIEEVLDYMIFLKEKDNERHEDNYYRSEQLEDSYCSLVELMTIYVSKGLEFDVVFVLYEEKKSSKSIHYLRRQGKTSHLLLGRIDNSEKKELESKQKQELKNLYYVAFTRAKQAVFIPLNFYNPFLSEIIESCYKNDLFQKKSCQLFYQPDLQKSYEESLLCPQEKFDQKRPLIKLLKDSEKILLNQKRLWNLSFSSMKGFLTDSKIELPFISDEIKKIKPEEIIFENTAKKNWFLPSGTQGGVIMHDLLQTIFHQTKMNDRQSIWTCIHPLLESTFLDRSSLQEIKAFQKNKTFKGLENSFIDDYQKIYETFYASWIKENNISFYEIVFTEMLQAIGNIVLPQQQKLLYDILKNRGLQEITIDYFDRQNKTLLKGILDFVFLGDDQKFYFLDWKTNMLDNYTQKTLKKVVEQEYSWQWKIYYFILIEFLKKTLKDFNYEKHVGGFYYWFVRGVGEEPSHGIYFVPALTQEEYRSLKENTEKMIEGQQQYNQGVMNA